MARPTKHLGAGTGQKIDAILQRLRKSKDVGPYLQQVLEIAVTLTDADMGTLQRFDERGDCLRIVASLGFSKEALRHFSTVHRETNSTCALALMTRMAVFVEDISKSYIFVGTRELDMLRATGVAAVQSTPLISSSSGRLWGVFSTHFHEPQLERDFNRAPLGRLAAQVADSLEQRERFAPAPHFSREGMAASAPKTD